MRDIKPSEFVQELRQALRERPVEVADLNPLRDLILESGHEILQVSQTLGYREFDIMYDVFNHLIKHEMVSVPYLRYVRNLEYLGAWKFLCQNFELVVEVFSLIYQLSTIEDFS